MIWMLCGPSLIYERHRQQILSTMQSIRSGDLNASIVTWNQRGTNRIVIDLARKMSVPCEVVRDGKITQNFLIHPSRPFLTHHLYTCIEKCDRGVVFLNIRSDTAMEAFIQLHYKSKLHAFVPIDSGAHFVPANGNFGQEKEIGLEKMEE